MSSTTASPAVTMSLPFTPRSASVARSRLQSFLHDNAQPDDVVDDSRLVLSELIGNAVRHARPLPDNTMVVGWQYAADSAGIDLFVTDGGSETVPHQVVNESADAFGRGLTLVEALATSWWYEASDDPRSGTIHALVGLDDSVLSA